MDSETSEPFTLWTIGHSNIPVERFLDLLRSNQIEILADVRSQPRSSYSPQFNSASLQDSCEEAGIRYAYFGDTLGGRPAGDHFYDGTGHVRYDLVAESLAFLKGIERLERGIRRGHRIAIVCSEENPSVCHRQRLVGRVLARRGTKIRHIRGDGRIQTDAGLLHETGRAVGSGQVALFGLEEALN